MIRKTKGIILRQRHFRDTSLIFSFYTKDYGRIEALAKGIKRGISKGEGGMEIFGHAELVYYEKSARRLKLLSQWYPLDSFKSLRTDLLKLVSASYLVELVDEIIHGEEKNEKIYYLLFNSLHSMESEQDISKLIHFFEIKLLGLLGYGPGIVTRGNIDIIPPRAVSLIQFLEKADLETLSRLKMSESDEEELNTVIQKCLRTFLGDNSIRTLRVIRKLKSTAI